MCLLTLAVDYEDSGSLPVLNKQINLSFDDQKLLQRVKKDSNHVYKLQRDKRILEKRTVGLDS